MENENKARRKKVGDRRKKVSTRREKIGARGYARLCAAGFAAGVVNGVFGVGGGVLIVFTLSLLFGGLFPDKRYIFANTCAVILPMALASVLIYSSFSMPDLSLSVGIGVSALAGGIIGAFLLGKLSPRVLGMIFSGVMILSGILMLFRG